MQKREPQDKLSGEDRLAMVSGVFESRTLRLLVLLQTDLTLASSGFSRKI